MCPRRTQELENSRGFAASVVAEVRVTPILGIFRATPAKRPLLKRAHTATNNLRLFLSGGSCHQPTQSFISSASSSPLS